MTDQIPNNDVYWSILDTVREQDRAEDLRVERMLRRAGTKARTERRMAARAMSRAIAVGVDCGCTFPLWALLSGDVKRVVPDHPFAVYLVRSCELLNIYAGATGVGVRKRLLKHISNGSPLGRAIDNSRGEYTAWTCQVLPADTRDAGLRLERLLIRGLAPALNIGGCGRNARVLRDCWIDEGRDPVAAALEIAGVTR